MGNTLTRACLCKYDTVTLLTLSSAMGGAVATNPKKGLRERLIAYIVQRDHELLLSEQISGGGIGKLKRAQVVAWLRAGLTPGQVLAAAPWVTVAQLADALACVQEEEG